MHSLYFTMSARYYPERSSVRIPPWKSLGLCLRVTNKGESGFGKANDRVEAKDHLPQRVFSVVVHEVPSQ